MVGALLLIIMCLQNTMQAPCVLTYTHGLLFCCCLLLQATAVGAKETEATNFLEKKVKAGVSYSYEEACQTAIAALQVSCPLLSFK